MPAEPPGLLCPAANSEDGTRHLRADDGIRTRDPHLGKVMLYQLSHVRTVGPICTGPSRQPGLLAGAFRTVADPRLPANSPWRSAATSLPQISFTGRALKPWAT